MTVEGTDISAVKVTTLNAFRTSGTSLQKHTAAAKWPGLQIVSLDEIAFAHSGFHLQS